MSLREVHAPHLGRTIKLGGRKRPVAMGPHLRLKNYLRKTLPSAPTSADYSQPAISALASVMMNDQLGCCVVSGGAHITAVETGNAGALFMYSNDQIIADYSAIGGYRPGDPSTDNGCDMQTALNYWTQHGFANGTKLMGWLAVDATDDEEVAQALYLFENLYMATELPDGWISPFPSVDGFEWGSVGPIDPQNGHCIMACGYDSSGRLKIGTWGLLGWLTADARRKYFATAGGGELYVMLSPDQLAKGQTRAPNGVDWTSLLADWDALGGSVPLVSPAPAPLPPVGPISSPVPLQAAQQWALQGLSQGHVIVTRAQAAALVTGALAKNWPAGS